MTGADVGERDDARRDRHLTASKNQDEFSAGTAAVTHAPRARKVKPNPEATRFDCSQGLSRAEPRHVEPERQSA
jgi:hypothetical protein